MEIVVDTNLIFSAILKPTSRIAVAITAHSSELVFISIPFLKRELNNHSDKLMELSGLTQKEVRFLLKRFLSRLIFFDLNSISDVSILEAERLADGVDIKDSPFVALAFERNALLWTGDKKLIQGLTKKGFNQVISTNELYEKYF